MKKSTFYRIIGGVAGIAAILSFLAFPLSDRWKLAIAIEWLILPPVFFFFELHWVRNHMPDELQNCKMSQESASKIWQGISAALLLVYFGK
jgi:cyanate permease